MALRLLWGLWVVWVFGGVRLVVVWVCWGDGWLSGWEGACRITGLSVRGEQAAYVVTHATAELDAAEAVADGQEEIVQFEVPPRGGMLSDYPRRLPRRCHYQRRCRTIEGRAP
jgi:hypothetical protein